MKALLTTLVALIILQSEFSAAFKIYVKTPSGGTITLQAQSDEKIAAVKAEIQEEEGIPIDQQTLSYNNQELQNVQTLGYYKIKDESTIELEVD
uniref:Putative ubiquitin/60s ribosomal protein l40 fusion n=1 Tax=Amblyomma triste TaxID=251400 RepID=A0A023G1M0_AMBTT